MEKPFKGIRWRWERGQCVYYSLVDTEGRKIETEDVYRHNVQPEKHVIKEEEEELNKVIEETEKEWVDTPSSTFGFTPMQQEQMQN